MELQHSRKLLKIATYGAFDDLNSKALNTLPIISSKIWYRQAKCNNFRSSISSKSLQAPFLTPLLLAIVSKDIHSILITKKNKL